MDIDEVVSTVAAAVGLAEGESGIRDILSAVLTAEPAAVREIARLAELPVPIVAATCNELRKHGVIDTQRPVRLTAGGRAAVAEANAAAGLRVACPQCGGRGEIVPAELTDLAATLHAIAAGTPGAKAELDQTHCTVDTKLGRVLRLQRARALAGQRIILLGDDDLVSVAVAHFAARTGGVGAIRRLTVVDTDADILAWIERNVAGTGIVVETVRHDLRRPLPAGLAGAFDVVLTDPPYTVPGAQLFLSRAVSALVPEPGRHVFFSFGARRPDETIAVQRAMTEMGLVVRSLAAAFNEYVGAGVLAGTSNLYHLRTTADARPLIEGDYDGLLYTADNRAVPTRPYRCASCRAVHDVGPGGRWPKIAALQAAGCPDCGGTIFRPMPLQSRGDRGVGPGPAAAREPAGAAVTRYVVRPAAAGDIEAIVGYEIDIAVVSFGDEAITDPALHRKRVTGALGKPGEIMLIAAADGAPDTPVGWAWVSARTNSLTGDRYGNFRSLATSDGPDRGHVGEVLMTAVLAAVDEAGLTQLTGKVHAGNLGMRTLYRKYGFTATHLTMERRAAPTAGPIGAPQPAADGGPGG
jgi:predicted methyltransferase/DNA-directed RNA polymerase subunit RPC12/RpoP